MQLDERLNEEEMATLDMKLGLDSSSGDFEPMIQRYIVKIDVASSSEETEELLGWNFPFLICKQLAYVEGCSLPVLKTG